MKSQAINALNWYSFYNSFAKYKYFGVMAYFIKDHTTIKHKNAFHIPYLKK